MVVQLDTYLGLWLFEAESGTLLGINGAAEPWLRSEIFSCSDTPCELTASAVISTFSGMAVTIISGSGDTGPRRGDGLSYKN